MDHSIRLGKKNIIPLLGINMGAHPIIGYNYGARQFDRVKKTLLYSIIGGVILTTSCF